jgi:DNA ligase-1
MKPLTTVPSDVTPDKLLPTLYKKTSTDADQMWSIGTFRNIIITQFGQVGGKIQETHDIVKTGKNIGRSNETTAIEQAELEAQAQWEKKKTAKGYVESLSDARKGKRDALVKGGIDPMLAHRFDEQGHKIVYPALAQPKFDGHRCIAAIDDAFACTLWSRTRKPITGLPHIIRDVETWAKRTGQRNIILDGELYNHDYREKFEELTSFIRNADPKPGHEVVEYHIYDVASEGTFSDRHSILSAFSLEGVMRKVETVPVTDEDDLMLTFDQFLVQGYEGLMVRNMMGEYVNKRSYDLQKVKEFIDEEFVVVGVEEGRGKLAGHGIFVCKTRDGVEFRAKMAGELESLKQYYEHPKMVVGKLLTVKFQGYTAKNGVPRFPVALRLRENI